MPSPNLPIANPSVGRRALCGKHLRTEAQALVMIGNDKQASTAAIARKQAIPTAGPTAGCWRKLFN